MADSNPGSMAVSFLISPLSSRIFCLLRKQNWDKIFGLKYVSVLLGFSPKIH